MKKLDNTERKVYLRKCISEIADKFQGQLGYDEKGLLNSVYIDKDNCATISLQLRNGELQTELIIKGDLIVNYFQNNM
jgi:hypothetical protein